MTRIIKNLVVVVLVVVSLFGSAVAGAPISQSSEPPPRELVWRALLLTMEQRGLAVMDGSQKDGQIVSAFGSLDPNAVSKTTLLKEQDKQRKWAGAEYRYFIDIGKRLLIRSEIRAWERENQGAPAGPDIKQTLLSNNTLEREFLQDFMIALGKLDQVKQGG